MHRPAGLVGAAGRHRIVQLRTAFRARVRGAAGRRRNRGVARGDRADRWPRHRQDHHDRAAARPAPRACRAGRDAAAADRAGRTDRQGGGAAGRGGGRGGPTARRGRPGAAGRPVRDHAAPAAGSPAGYVGAVQAQSRQPAAARRHRGGRDVDGVVDDDGPAGRSGPPGLPVDSGRRPGPVGLGGGGRRAGRPGGRAVRPRRRAGGRPAHAAPIRHVDRRAGRGDSGRRRGPGGGAAGGRGRARRVGGCTAPGRSAARGARRARAAAAVGRAPGRGRRGAGHAGRTPAAVRAPRGPVWGDTLEHVGAEVDCRGDGAAGMVAVVRRAPAAGDRQRLRPAALQRRHRCGGGRRGGPAGGHRRCQRAARLRDQPSRRGGDDARHDHPQESGQPGRRGDRADTAGGFATADAGTVLHGRDPGADQGAGGGAQASVRAAIERRAMRATGLRQRLRADAAAT